MVRSAAADICVRWVTPSLISASVRDAAVGVVDIRWTSYGGWTCTCMDKCCHHIARVKSLTMAAVGGAHE
jgi:hypothetical protein